MEEEKMRQKREFLITQGSKDAVVDRPDWFNRIMETNVGNKSSLEKWGEEFATELKLEDIYTEDEVKGYDRVDDYSLVVTDDDEEQVITPATNRYNLIQNSEVIEPLMEVINDFNIEVVGFVRDYKGRAVIDIYPTHHTLLFESPDAEEALAFGQEIRIGHDKTESVKSRPIVQDSYDRTTMRGLSDWSRLKHVKPEEVDSKDISTRLYQMFAKSFLRLGYMASTYIQEVEEAYFTEVDFSEEEFNPEEFYKVWLDEDFIPDKVKEVAPRKALVREGIYNEMVEEVPEDVTLNMWSIISGYTYAVGHESSTTDGYNKDRFHRKATDALSNPENTIHNVRDNYGEDEEDEVDIEEKAAQLSADMSQM
jgi:hypothetical protein